MVRGQVAAPPRLPRGYSAEVCATTSETGPGKATGFDGSSSAAAVVGALSILLSGDCMSSFLLQHLDVALLTVDEVADDGRSAR